MRSIRLISLNHRRHHHVTVEESTRNFLLHLRVYTDPETLVDLVFELYVARSLNPCTCRLSTDRLTRPCVHSWKQFKDRAEKYPEMLIKYAQAAPST